MSLPSETSKYHHFQVNMTFRLWTPRPKRPSPLTPTKPWILSCLSPVRCSTMLFDCRNCETRPLEAVLLRWDVLVGSCCLVLGCFWSNLRKQVSFKFLRAHNKEFWGCFRRTCWQFNGVQTKRMSFRFWLLLYKHEKWIVTTYWGVYIYNNPWFFLCWCVIFLGVFSNSWILTDGPSCCFKILPFEGYCSSTTIPISAWNDPIWPT